MPAKVLSFGAATVLTICQIVLGNTIATCKPDMLSFDTYPMWKRK